jgi:hypothetical protein
LSGYQQHLSEAHHIDMRPTTLPSPISTDDESSSLFKNRRSQRSSTSLKRRRSTRRSTNATATASSLLKAINYNQASSEDSADPFDRMFYEEDVTSSPFYTCPQAPVHSNEYLMSINAHKYHYDNSMDLYCQMNHSGSMLASTCCVLCTKMRESDSVHHMCPYVSLATMEQENLQLRMRIEELEQRVIQLETAS